MRSDINCGEVDAHFMNKCEILLWAVADDEFLDPILIHSPQHPTQWGDGDSLPQLWAASAECEEEFFIPQGQLQHNFSPN
jgi:hypothetical protein